MRLYKTLIVVIITAVFAAGCGGGGGGGGGPVGTITGTVVTAGTLTPIQGVSVTVIENGKTTATDTQGRFTLQLAPGAYTLRFTKTNYELRERPVLVVEGQNPELDAVWLVPSNTTEPPGQGIPRTIEGTVRLSDTTNSSGVKAELLSGTTVLETFASTASDGKYHFWIYPGSYTIRLSKTGYVTRTTSATVVDTGTVVQVPTVTLQKQ